jgi:hypothetical protein
VARVTSELQNDATADTGQPPSGEPTWVAADAPSEAADAPANAVVEAAPGESKVVETAVEKDASQAQPTEPSASADEVPAQDGERRPQRVSAPSRLRLLDRLAGLSRTS